jgi:hypothetical protein
MRCGTPKPMSCGQSRTVLVLTPGAWGEAAL